MAITKISPDLVDFDSALVVSPTLTIGDATAEDTKIVFDGNAQDYYIGLDDSADDLVIGLGSVVGSSPAISINEDQKVTLPKKFTVDAADGAADNDWVAFLRNQEGTDDRNFGLYLVGGSTSSDQALRIDNQRTGGGNAFVLDGAGKVGIGVTPSGSWDANLDAIQVGEVSAFRSGDTDYSAATVVSTNLYQTGGGDKLLNGTDLAAQYLQQGGNHYFYGYNSGSADATPAVAADDLVNPLVIAKGGGLSISGGSVANTANGKAGIFWHTIADGADYCIRRTSDAWSASNYAQLLLDWDTGVKIDAGGGTYGKSYLEVNGNVKFTASGQGIDFSATGDGSGTDSSELLDDYEEGSWTPTIGTGTFSTSDAYYVKVGRFVKFSFRANTFSDISTNTSIAIGGLPYPVETNQALGSVMGIQTDNTDADTSYANTSETLYFYSLSSGGWDAMTHADLNLSSADFYVQGSYRTEY